MARIYWTVKQGSPEWFRLRAGVPSASEFDQVITPKKGEPSESRHKYACRLIAQRLMNWQAESLDTIKHIEDGKVNEPFAVAQLEALADIQTHRVGFILSHSGRFGASPDRAVGGHPDAPDGIEEGSLDAVLEVKSPTIPKQFEYLLLGHDAAYRTQVQGQLYVAEADKAIFYSYQNRMPAYQVETGRDEPFIRKLRDCLNQFHEELEAMMEKAQGLGVYQAFTELRTPLDQEYGENLRRAPLETEAELAEIIEGATGNKLSWGG